MITRAFPNAAGPQAKKRTLQHLVRSRWSLTNMRARCAHVTTQDSEILLRRQRGTAARYFLIVLTAVLAAAGWQHRRAVAGDWPQILGPHRNGQADNERLPDRWPAGGPKVLWRHAIGSGFAGPAVVGQEVYIFHRMDDAERLERLDARTGKPVWRTDFSASYLGGVNPDNGPRCAPLVYGENVYLFGAAGDLHCVARGDGAKKWSRSTHTEFGASDGYFGAGSTPIVVSGVLLVNVGGSSEGGIVAFSLATGETAWKIGNERASYAAPTQTLLGGKPYAVFVTRYNALAIAPQSGEIRFRFPFGQRGPTVNAATPLVFDDRLFLSSSYGIGCVLARIDGPAPKVLWSGDGILSSQYNTAIYYQHHLYGIHGREDQGIAELRCVDVRDGKVTWKVPGFGVAHLILADSKLLVLKVDGRLLLADPNPQRFTRLDEARVSDYVTRALPALAAGRLYLRDNFKQEGSLKCLVVGR